MDGRRYGFWEYKVVGNGERFTTENLSGVTYVLVLLPDRLEKKRSEDSPLYRQRFNAQ